MVMTKAEEKATTTKQQTTMASSTTSSTSSKDEKKKPVLVPRKKLQNLPDLLANGDEESTPFESTTSKVIWMIFLMALFYLSFEIFIKFTKDRNFGDGGGRSSGGYFGSKQEF